ncbi:cell wall hydrolase [Fictibacillus aquaticus]|uniref:Cell wall hydrolase n=1 Tax=Fictibacillus aquaticus TaxID=2021314 RepID=A0A235F8H8_9BACL|nr:cell wall hydrolase [Fictibacillus aquaticus]OYD57364.1 cell wall hydrolase [Fictibacillus aquaticus]
MAVINYTSKDVDLLARLIRAEAEGEGDLGMLLVGNTGVNRIRSNCLDFKKITNMRQMVFQRPGGFEATIKGYFYQGARANERRLAQQVINGRRFHPATNSLWFFDPKGACPPKWYNQPSAGSFKAHCFYQPTPKDCPNVFNTF